MGVPGLWDVLRPAGKSRSLTHLAVDDGFNKNKEGHRAYRIGIDASIWFFHAQGGREGENPELRTLFFRCARLAAMPFLPIFVFDGPKRPKIKRGKTIGGKEHWMVNSLRTVLDAFGFESRTAPGEAEAELAYLNRIGVIDAILSDDVDCFIFGAHTVMRNSSSTLSGNVKHTAKNSDGKDDGHHINLFHATDLASHKDVGLTQGGLILIALLRGGDYDQKGIDGCGVRIAHPLARAGFGDRLLQATRSKNPDALAAFLPTWRAALRHELATNASGVLPHKAPSVAKRIGEDFPPLDVLKCYTHPITAESEGLGTQGLDKLWRKPLDVGKVARVCELYFEWGVERMVVKRFRSFMWPGAVLRTILQNALDKDAAVVPSSNVETPSKILARSLNTMVLGNDDDEDEDVFKLVKTIHSERRHASTDHLLEYRLEIDPRELVTAARAGMQGTRQERTDSAAAGVFFGSDEEAEEEEEDHEEEGGKKQRGTKANKLPADPDSTLRIWMPAVMVEYAYPALVVRYRTKKDEKAAKKAKSGPSKKKTKMDIAREREEKPEPRPTESESIETLFKAAGSVQFSKKAETDVTNEQSRLKKDVLAPLGEKGPGGSATLKTPVKPSKTATYSVDSSPSSSSKLGHPFFKKPTEEEESPTRAPKPSSSRHYISPSSSDEDEDVFGSPKKRPRKSSGTGGRASPPELFRSPLSSPSRIKTTVSGSVRPLQLAAARIAKAPKSEEVIVISSDSEEYVQRIVVKPTKAKAKAKALNRSRHHDSEVIDLT